MCFVSLAHSPPHSPRSLWAHAVPLHTSVHAPAARRTHVSYARSLCGMSAFPATRRPWQVCKAAVILLSQPTRGNVRVRMVLCVSPSLTPTSLPPRGVDVGFDCKRAPRTDRGPVLRRRMTACIFASRCTPRPVLRYNTHVVPSDFYC